MEEIRLNKYKALDITNIILVKYAFPLLYLRGNITHLSIFDLIIASQGYMQ